MIAFLQGKVIYKQVPIIILNVNGVGYELSLPMSTFYNLPELNQETSLFCYQYIREDANVLYGFSNLEQRKLFTALLKTNGVGPRLALTVLSNFQINEFLRIINNGDSKALVKLPGVGKKTAERLVLELQDRLKKIFNVQDAELNTGSVQYSAIGSENSGMQDLQANDNTVMDAICALETLGYKYNDANKVVNKLLDKANYNSSEELIKAALKEFR